MRQGNRRWALIIAGIVGLLLVTFLLRRQAASPSSRRSSTVAKAAGPSGTGPRVTPVPGASLRITGVVKEGALPVAGVRVSASRVDPAETLSERPCPAPDLVTADAGAAGFAPRIRLMDCWPQAQARLLEQVSAREGEAPVLAETTTTADGTFVLDGLPEGAVTLWALGEAGAVKQHDILAGTRDVVLSLDEGLVFEGNVKVEGSPEPLTEVTLTLFSHHHTRFFDVRADARGHFRLGPLPRTRYAALFALAGEGVLLLQDVEAADLEDLTLHRPSRFSGQVVSEQGAPAAGVQVWLSPPTSEPDPQVTTTDPQGRFAFTSALPSEHELFTRSSAQDAFASIESPPAEGLLLQLRPGVFLQGTVRDDTGKSVAGAKVTARPFQPVALGERGQAVTRADGSYRLGPLAISEYLIRVKAEHHLDEGPVDHEVDEHTEPLDFTLARASSVEGQLVDEAGQPLAGLEVKLHTGELRRTGTDADEDVAVSDETGRFVLDSQAVGPGWLEIDADRFIRERFAVRIPSRGIRRVLRRGATVSGTVVSMAGAPLPGIELTLWKREGQDDAERSGATDEQGRFTLQGVSPGRYVVEASLQTPAYTRSASQPVEVADGETATVSLRMEGNRTLAGLTVDGAGRPVPGVIIRMGVPEGDLPRHRQSSGMSWMNVEGLRSDDKGRFFLKHLDASRYVLSANRADYDLEPARSQGGLPGKDRTLIVGSDVREVRLVLHRRPHARGRVVGPGGAPVTSFSVGFDQQRSPSGNFDVDLSGATDRHALVFRAKGMAPLERTFTLEGGADVDLGTLTLSEGRTVRGVLRDAQTGLPLSGEVREDSGSWVQHTGTVFYRLRSEGPGDPVLAYRRLRAALTPDGTCLLEHLPSTPLTLELEVPGYLPLRQTLDAGAREFTALLERGARVEVNIRDAQERPMRAMLVMTMPDGDTQQRMASTGTVVMSGLSPGLYSFTASPLEDGKPHSSDRFQPKSLRVPASGQVALTLEALERGATLTLRLEDDILEAFLIPGSEPWPEDDMASRRLEARGHPQERLAQLPVTLRFDRVPAGHYTLFAIHRARDRIHREELELPAEGAVSLEVRPVWRPLAP
ncbi:carboxypeptidase-like regulatory domain-containing protein [Corallococcus carmarthensis]|uniref:Carboxypeptidase regulatory-like domain-containing protein n=1 Tax=Corallococcus carmarthensis TaxID=2316728 RepID=A0A3A8KI72_9BACT|nr:carboxypeptidase-like regulatory domain-containing protein [Corallococcus carmarthensis]RKH07037.1 carboxypeptidase regulatory-like domain-containing protein [Corallococcus carmarthensis]